MFRPEIGLEMLLVYRECVNGHWCATGEGAVAPVCGECGHRMMPGGGGPQGEPLYGDSHHESRRIRGLGFRALFGNEIAISETLGRPEVRRAQDAHGCRRSRYFTEREIARAAEGISRPEGWPAEEVTAG